MKRFIALLLMACCLQVQAQQNKSTDIIAAQSLVKRVVPQYANAIQFQKIEHLAIDSFYIEWKNNQLLIKGSNVNAMAVGLNYYLKNICLANVSWYKNEGVTVPQKIPVLKNAIGLKARCNERFFLNYCTFGYTMPWWGWQDWQWFIDWMALNGINMPLAITGQEAIWYKVWKKFGLTDEQIRSFFTGPAYLPWHRMANIDRWEGPLPTHWINSQLALQKKIVQREKDLGMKPVLPAFAGHVPQALATIYPKAKIHSLGEWGDFSQQYQSYFLDPFDSLFKPIQKAYLKEQTQLLGTSHIYGTDPFNEVTPPSWEPAYLASVANTIYESMLQTDPKAEWLQMSWIFYYQRKQWTDERIKTFLTAVPQGKMTLLDYYCDNTEIWKFTNAFYAQPYIWCYLGNFGGNTMMSGNLSEIEERMENTFQKGGSNMKGVGSTLEGFGVNPIMYQYVFDKAWSTGSVNVADWVNKWAKSRYGASNVSVEKAWNILLNTTYAERAGLGRSTLTNARPAFTGHNTWTTDPQIKYSNKNLLEAWHLLLLAPVNAHTPPVYSYDVVNTGRQVLGNYFTVLRDAFTKSYQQHNAMAVHNYGLKMLDVLSDMDTLLATNQNFLLGSWIADAEKMASTSQEKQYYAQDAKRILTVWGEPGKHLTDYANRAWAGLMQTYYRERWKIFIDAVEKSMQENTAWNQEAFNQSLTTFEADWVENKLQFPDHPTGNTMQVSKRLYAKYVAAIMAVK
ncbi:alpha-N-acetylglucosaminidase [Hydrotalea sp.]|uniref:alpha-N-acetylglucosaminidase n=1 Tax=Hydrotalea sp. TaxID=2881279 RepID=UPI00262A01C8|nr:alpha-N-acetylglucosaminidase [Hydrotalea sp.]